MPHKPPTQAKYLEQPAREMSKELQEDIKKMLAAGKTLSQALLIAGMKLQAAAQRICPVDTGNLRASAYTSLNPNG